MDSRVAALENPPVYEDFEASSDFVEEKDCDTILLHLPGFRKEYLKVLVTTSKNLRISGSRPIGDNKWRRFQKEFPVSPNHDTPKISAKFEGGILYVRLPKLITSGEKKEERQDSKLPASDAAKTPQKPADQPPPQKSSVQEHATEKPAKKDDSTKQTNAQNVKEEPKVAKEKHVEPTDLENKAKKTPEEQASGLDGSKKESIAGDKREDDKAKKSPEEKASGLDDSKKRSIAGDKQEDDRVKKSPEEKTRGLDDSKKKSIAGDKREDDSMKAAEKRKKKSTETLDGSGKTGIQNYKETAVDLAPKLKEEPRRIFNLILIVLFALAFGLYITKFIRSLKRDEN